MTGTIPNSVLDLLKNEWQPAEPGQSTFDFVLTRSPERLSNPSFYHYYRDDLDHQNNDLTGREIASLVADEVLPGLLKETSGGYSANEHAQHALQDFCKEVYAAWEKFERRIQSIP